MNKQAEKIVVKTGSMGTNSSGFTWSKIKEVEFVGIQLAYLRERCHNNTRGIDFTLYQVGDDLWLHIYTWSLWQGETDHYELEKISPDDLGPLGPYSNVGALCGFGRPITLDEYLTTKQD